MLRNIVIIQQLFVEHLLYLTALQDIDTLSVNKTKTHTQKAYSQWSLFTWISFHVCTHIFIYYSTVAYYMDVSQSV